jgi:suppressor of ftsI
VVRLGADSVSGLLYNNSYLPPLLRVRVGDVMNINFKNRLTEDPSNLHFHGMAVSPQGNSDNVFIHVHPGQNFQYKVSIPAHRRQGPGMFWYHPHAHGVVSEQILGGMSGGLVVDGSESYFPLLKDLPERFLLIKHFSHPDGEIISVNGEVNPAIEMKSGEVQFWRIAHIGASMYIRLRFERTPLYVIATDGHYRSRPERMTELFLGPGERVDALVTGPPAGEYPVVTGPFQNQAWKAPGQAQRVAFHCTGARRRGPAA